MIRPLSCAAIDHGKGVGVNAKTKSMIPGSFACQVLNSAHGSCCVTALQNHQFHFIHLRVLMMPSRPQITKQGIKIIDIANLKGVLYN